MSSPPTKATTGAEAPDSSPANEPLVNFHELVESAPAVVAVLDSEHRIIYANSAVGRITGSDVAALLGKRQEQVMPAEVDLWGKAIDDVLRTGRGEVIEYTIKTPGGPRQFASLMTRLNHNRVCAVSCDITDLRSGRILDTAARTLSTGMMIVEAPSGRILFKNDETDRVFGKVSRDVRGIEDYDAVLAFDRHGQRIVGGAWPIARALAGETIVGERVEVHRPNGGRNTISINASPVRDTNGAIIAAVSSYSDITDATRAHDAASYLAQVGELLERFDPATSLQSIVDLAVPTLADWCFVHLKTSGNPTLAAIAHVDPALVAVARTRAAVLKPLSRDTAVARVLAGGPREIVNVDDTVLEQAGQDPSHLAHLRGRGYRSSVVAPLAGRDGVLGAVTFAMAESGRHYEAADLDMLAELARRTGIALENARLFAAEKQARHHAEEARDRTRRLQELTVALSRAIEKADVASIMVDAGRNALGAAAGFAWLMRDEKTLELAASAHAGKIGRLELFKTIPMTAPLPVCEVIRTAQPLMFQNLAEMSETYPSAIPADGSPYQSWAVIPFVITGRGIGAVSFSFVGERVFSEEDRQLLVAMSGQASLALERSTLIEAERRARTDAEAAVQRARLADRRKDEFLAMLGHELRNPLAPIATALQLMKLKDATSLRKEREIIHRQVEHLSRLVGDLLDVSRITSGRIPLDLQVVEVEAVLSKAVEMASPLLESRAQRLTIDVPSDGLPIDADPTRLAQVFQNLLTNASKYSDPQAEIELLARLDGDHIVVDVRDHGIGVPAEVMPRLFELFVQGPRTIDRSDGGLGIGLTIAKSLCDLHGATIGAASAGVGHGSTFTVRIPMSAHPLSVAPTIDVSLRRSVTGVRVLVVDDNVDAALTLSELLAELGHELAVAHDGPAALELAGSFKPHVALLDIGLPVMDGYELARKLREQLREETPRLIAVTGYGQDADRSHAREAGFDHHVTKPVDFDKLVPLLVQAAMTNSRV